MAEPQTDKVAFELVTPTAVLVSEPADMVVVPGAEGDFGVLPGHAPMISTLRPGLLDVHQEGRLAERYFVAAGFAEASPARCTVLADVAMPVAEIDRAEAQERLRAAREAVESAEAEARAEAELELRVAEAMVAASERGLS